MFGSTLRGAATLAEQYGDSLDGPPDGNGWTQWTLGAGAAAVPLIAGLTMLVRGGLMMAIFWISLGLFVHFHYFWGLSKRLSPYSDLAKSITAIPLIGIIVYGTFCRLAFG